MLGEVNYCKILFTTRSPPNLFYCKGAFTIKMILLTNHPQHLSSVSILNIKFIPSNSPQLNR